jgi:hypothetical protein
MISELNQPEQIASLECGSVKIPCLPEVFVFILGAACMTFISHLAGGRLFLLSSVFLAVTLVQKNPPVRSADARALIWDIDLTLASDLPRNFRTTDDPL